MMKMVNYAKLNKKELIEILCKRYGFAPFQFSGHSKEWILNVLRERQEKERLKSLEKSTQDKTRYEKERAKKHA